MHWLCSIYRESHLGHMHLALFNSFTTCTYTFTTQISKLWLQIKDKVHPSYCKRRKIRMSSPQSSQMSKVHPLSMHSQIWRNHERLKEPRTFSPTSPILQLVQFTWLEKIWLINETKRWTCGNPKRHKFSNNVILLGNNLDRKSVV